MLSKKMKLFTMGLAAFALTQPSFGESPNALMTWPLDEAPTGLAVGPDGQIAITINNDHRIVQFSSESDEVIGSIDLEDPAASVALGPEGIITVYSSASSGLVQYTDEGEVLAHIVLDGQPHLAAANALGETAVAAAGEGVMHGYGDWGRLTRYGADGRILGDIPLHDPVDLLSVGSDGTMAITINNDHRVALFSGEGEALSEVEIGTEVHGLAAGADGTVSVIIDNDYQTSGAGAAGLIVNNDYQTSGGAGIIIDHDHRTSGAGAAGLIVNNDYQTNGEGAAHSYKAVHLSAEGAVFGEVPLRGKPLHVAVDVDGFLYAAFSDRVEKHAFGTEELSSEFDGMEH